MSLSVISRRRITSNCHHELNAHQVPNRIQIRPLFALQRATPSEGGKTGIAEPHIAEQSMPVSNGFGSRNFGIIARTRSP